jgi:hypothetical protein
MAETAGSMREMPPSTLHYNTYRQIAYFACVAQYLSGAQIFAAGEGGSEPRRLG